MTASAKSHGACDGLVQATLGKACDAVKAFSCRLAMNDVVEADRTEYATAFFAAFGAEAKSKREWEARS